MSAIHKQHHNIPSHMSHMQQQNYSNHIQSTPSLNPESKEVHRFWHSQCVKSPAHLGETSQ